MAMLYMPTAFLRTDLDAWFQPSARKVKEQSLYTLEQLHILNLKQDEERRYSYSLNPGFAKSLRQALEGSGTHRSFGVPASRNEDREQGVTVEFLDLYAREQWESILFYMVASTAGLKNKGQVGKEIGEGTKTLLKEGGFVRTAHGKVGITREGFSFVLQETNAQVWSLLIVYLRMVGQLGMTETDVLSFLFMLGSLELGQDYSTSTLSPTQLQMLEDLSAFGIVYRSSKNAATFYPTRLATTLTSDGGVLSSSAISSMASGTRAGITGSANKGFIIIETNYRLYAYTDSLLQIAILSLFTKMTTRFPNLVSGKLTKESISKAVKHGISSAQILSYLTTYAHPQMQKNNPFLPPTVMDQIRLWEYEGERVETTNGYLMREFSSESEYRDVLAYAEALGVLVWKNDAKRVFFIHSIEQIQTYLKKRAMQRGA